MQMMIKGTSIDLYTGEDAETVENVLIGEGSTAGEASLDTSGGSMLTYTLAIPKGDAHTWTDRVVGFFGQLFRTVGQPVQGIEENVPLAWHKKVQVQLLNISGACTVYNSKTFEAHAFAYAYWHDGRHARTTKTGAEKAAALAVRLYADATRTDTYCPAQGDLIVCGGCDFTFDTSSEQAASESMTAFRAGYDYAVIAEVSAVTCGTLPDYEITAR